MKTMICLVLDRSGSMGGREGDVVGGVNTFLTEQRAQPFPACVALVRFDTEAIERFRPMTDLRECKDLKREEYAPRGGTPLLDAIGKTINQLDEDWKRERPDRAIMVIVTDGAENASREFTKQKISEMIKAREASGKWAFVYLGANVDAFAESSGMGFSAVNSAGYKSTARGTHALYSTVSAQVSRMRATGSTVANLGGNIDEDNTLHQFVATPLPTGPSTPAPWQSPDDFKVDDKLNVTPIWKAPEPTATWTPPA